MKTVTELRRAFWEAHPQFMKYYRSSKRQNDYNADIRSSFVMFVDNLHRDGVISDNLANRVIL